MLPCHAEELASLHERRVAKVAGRIVPCERESRRLVSPLGQVECACYVVTIMVNKEPVASEGDCVEFELTDETGVRVRIEGGDTVAAAGYGWDADSLSARFYKPTPELLERHGLANQRGLRVREIAFEFGHALAALGVVSSDSGITLIRPLHADSIPHTVLAHWRRADRAAWLALVEAHSRVLLNDQPRVIEYIVASASQTRRSRSSLVCFTVPNDVAPGSVVPVLLPDSTSFVNYTLPDSVRPGSTITIAVPPHATCS